MYKIKSGLDLKGKLKISDVELSGDNNKLLALGSDGTVNYVTGTTETLDTVTKRFGATGNDVLFSGSSTFTGNLFLPDNSGGIGGAIWLGTPNSTGNTAPTIGYLPDLQDVTITTPVSGQALLFDGSVWTNQNIITDLSNYWNKTEADSRYYSSANPSGFITSSALAGYATESYVGSQGFLTGINSSDVTTALGFTPYNASNPSGFITGINSGMVTTALGYTPYNSSNPSGYITGINSGDVTTALGFTPYSSANPAGYISSYTETSTLTDVLNRNNTTSVDATFNSDVTITGTLTIPNGAGGTGGTIYIGTPNSTGSTAPVIAYLSDLQDISLSGLTNGQGIVYNSSLGKWVNQTIAVDLSAYSTTSQGDSRWLGIGATAVNSTQWSNQVYDNTSGSQAVPSYFMGYNSSAGKWTYQSIATSQAALGLGSAAYLSPSIAGSTAQDLEVSKYLRWKNYGSSHVIIDASNASSPTGSAISNTDADIAWTPTYPTLVGWNGGNTFGVRVDNARLADTATNWNGWTNSFSSSVQSGTITSILGQDSNAGLYRYNASAVQTFLGLGSGAYNDKTKLWSVSHPNDFYIQNTWNGAQWVITSNHGSPTRVGISDYADSAGTSTNATYWGGIGADFSAGTGDSVSQLMGRRTPDGYGVSFSASQVQSFLGLGDSAYINKSQLWNNNGFNHATYQSFLAIPNFGVYFMQNAAAGDSPQSGSQYYVQSAGLGNDYTYEQYALQTAIARDHAVKYQYLRTRENGTWGAWSKTAAGYADEAGSATVAANYLPLAGGTLTGNLVGTSATFNHSVYGTGGFKITQTGGAVPLYSYTDNGGAGWTTSVDGGTNYSELLYLSRGDGSITFYAGGTYSGRFINGGLQTGNITSTGNILASNGDFSSTDNSSTSYGVATIQLRESNRGQTGGYLPPRLAFHWAGVVASQIGLDADGTIKILNNPGTGYENLRANNIYGVSGVYDNGSRVLSQRGQSYYQVDTWLQMNDNHGLYWPNLPAGYTTQLHWYQRTVGTYGMFNATGIRNGYTGIYWENGGGVVSDMFDASGNGGTYDPSSDWHFYWHKSNACLGIGGSNTTAGFKMQVNGAAKIDSRLNLGGSSTTPYYVEYLDGITFGGEETSVQSGRMYKIYTKIEDIGGAYTKLNIGWHTGIKIGAYSSYGGTRFFNNSPETGTEIMSVGNGDNRVRVQYGLEVNGDMAVPTSAPSSPEAGKAYFYIV